MVSGEWCVGHFTTAVEEIEQRIAKGTEKVAPPAGHGWSYWKLSLCACVSFCLLEAVNSGRTGRAHLVHVAP